MRTLLSIATAVCVTGCFGDSFLDFNKLPQRVAPEEVSEPGEAPDNTIDDVDVTKCEPVKAGPTAFRRLTREEYKLTVSALLGDAAPEADAFIEDGLLHGFRNNHYSTASPLILNQYVEAAEKISVRAMAKLAQLSPCEVTTVGAEGCAVKLVETMGPRAFRRPLTQGELDRLVTLHKTARTALAYDFNDASRLVIAALLMSPNFLYHVELGDSTKAVEGTSPLRPFELASRLSYFLTASMPDAALWEAAKSGALSDRAELEKHARRLLETEAARARVTRFHREWLGIDKLEQARKDAALFPTFDDALKAAMLEETDRYVRSIVFEGDGRLDTLLTSNKTFANGQLASHYGMSSAATTFEPLTLDGNLRRGILSQGAFLAAHAHPTMTSPVLRGKAIREKLLCHIMPAPPPDVDVSAPTADPNKTTRERFAAHQSVAYCASCHRLMDPIGLGMEAFDSAGRHRATEASLPVDESGEVVSTLDIDGKFTGLAALATKLSQSNQVRDCTTDQWFVFAAGREAVDDEKCSLGKVKADFRVDHNIRELMVRIVRSHAFRHVAVGPKETCL